MIFKYGTFAHPENEVSISISKRAVYGDRGQRLYVRETWAIMGILQADTQAAITTALAAMRTAYSTAGLDAGLYLDNGTTLTDHYMISSNAKGGVRVTALDFPKGDGAEYSTFRTYSITLEADFYDTNLGNLLEFQETIELHGTGGRRRVLVETVEGEPDEQIVNQRTVVHATQSGQAVGIGAYPRFPSPLWPADEDLPERETRISGPKFRAGSLIEFPISWSYRFTSKRPLPPAMPHTS